MTTNATTTESTNGTEVNTADLLSRLLLNRDEVAALLGVPPSTVTALHEGRVLRGVKISKYIRWRPEDVRAFVEGLEARN